MALRRALVFVRGGRTVRGDIVSTPSVQDRPMIWHSQSRDKKENTWCMTRLKREKREKVSGHRKQWRCAHTRLLLQYLRYHPQNQHGRPCERAATKAQAALLLLIGYDTTKRKTQTKWATAVQVMAERHISEFFIGGGNK